MPSALRHHHSWNLMRSHAPFSLNPKILRANLVAENCDYDPENPQTWPIITLAAIEVALGRVYTGEEWVPEHVVYETAVWERFLGVHPLASVHQPGQSEKGNRGFGSTKTGYLDFYFRFFPLNFSEKGVLRKRIGITEAEFKSWMGKVCNIEPIYKKEAKMPIVVKEVGLMEERVKELERENKRLRREIEVLKKKNEGGKRKDVGGVVDREGVEGKRVKVEEGEVKVKVEGA